MAVFAPALSYLWEGARRFGLDPEKLFEEAGIDPQLRLDVNARVSVEQYDCLIWAADRHSGDDSFAFHLVENVHPSYMGALGYAWMTSATLRKAVECLQRYQRLLSDDAHLSLETDGNMLHLLLDPAPAKEMDPDLRERLRLASMVRLCRMICGREFRPARIQLRQGEPTRPAAWFAYFRCELQFGADRCLLAVDAAAADRRLPGHNAQLEVLLEKQIVDYLARLDRQDIVGRTKAAIFDLLPSGRANIDEVAASLDTSVRTLRRKLGDRGTSFKALLSGTRQELGERYIRDNRLSLTEIAFLLGFSDSSSFSRAYRSWTGQTPTRYRSEQAASSKESH